MNMLEYVTLFSLAAAFGGMVFFPAVVAPSVFRILDEENAGRFLRGMFPGYYLFLIVAFAGITVGTWQQGWWYRLMGGALLLSTIYVRQRLVPEINRYRDRELAGDTAAGLVFKKLHRFSVLINLVQLGAVIYLMV